MGGAELPSAGVPNLKTWGWVLILPAWFFRIYQQISHFGPWRLRVEGSRKRPLATFLQYRRKQKVSGAVLIVLLP